MKFNKCFYGVNLMLLLIISACTCTDEITSFQGVIETIGNYTVVVECSNAVNRNKKGNIEAIAYLCTVQLNEQSIIIGTDNQKLDIQDLRESQHVNIVLKIPNDINESVESREVLAKEIKVLTE
ncbi:hypothetical protein [Bacillus sp. AFS040349]|uniref:hypothetical protein n=1 Tax=Bacillus sp. AFS040349 TaxID=2033502 RepID=UPI000BFE89C6|nr:hypothetical protein [Bacillus sp. AFS040349]PGT78076.1 hypothetical protein COD11_24270 [Bacillus sp. AFS040349]